MTKIDSFDPPEMNPRVDDEPRPVDVRGLLVAALRRNWRLLRTMRTALWLLGVVGLETIVATIVPQEMNVAATVASWRTGEAGPGVAVSTVLDAVGAYDVYTSPIFIATLLLLFTSLTACMLPRIRSWWRIARHSVPPLSRHIGAQEHVVRLRTRLGQDEAQAAVRGVLADRGFRVRDGEADEDGQSQVAAEKGQVLREGGSLLFHLSFYVLLIGIVLGQLMTFEGGVGVVEQESFADTTISYGRYRPGRWFGPEDHKGWELHLDDFRVDWIRDPLAPFAGTPTTFEADVTVTERDGTVVTDTVAGNRPLVVDGSKIHLLGWGYAARVRIREGAQVVYDDYVRTVFDDEELAFTGVVKAPGATPDVGMELYLVPFAPDDDEGRPVPTGAPWADAPVLFYQSYTGDLQLSTTQAGSELDVSELEPGSFGYLRPGEILPVGGIVTVEFVELRQWTNLQVSQRPQLPALVLGSLLLLGGLLPALYAYRRRVWVGVRPDGDGRTLCTVGGRAFQRPMAFDEEFAELTAALRVALDVPTDEDPAAPDPPSEELVR